MTMTFGTDFQTVIANLLEGGRLGSTLIRTAVTRTNTGSGGYGGEVETYTVETAHWKMNDNAATKVVVETQGSHEGTSENNTDTMSTTGKISTALDFNGTTDYIVLTDSTDFEVATDDFSITAWVNPSAISADHVILGKSTATSDEREWWWGLESTGLQQLQTHTDGTTSNVKANSDTTISTGTFVHVAMVRSGSSVTFYLNGVADGTDTTDATIFEGTAVARIGTVFYSGVSQNRFAGAIDDLRFYKGTALTSEQIENIYNSGSGTEETVGVTVNCIPSRYLKDKRLGDYKFGDLDEGEVAVLIKGTQAMSQDDKITFESQGYRIRAIEPIELNDAVIAKRLILTKKRA